MDKPLLEITVIKENPVCFTDYLGSDKVVSNIINDMSKEDIDQVNNTA